MNPPAKRIPLLTHSARTMAFVFASILLTLSLFSATCAAVDLFDLERETPPSPSVSDQQQDGESASELGLVAESGVLEKIQAKPAALIRLPLVRQARDNTCGVACVQSILRHAGPEFDLREDLLIAKVGTDDSGTPIEGMLNFLNNVRLRDRAGKADDTKDPSAEQPGPRGERPVIQAEFAENLTLTDLQNCLDSGRPVICLLQAWDENVDGEYEIQRDYSRIWASGHYAVAIGYDLERIYFMDPSTMGNYTYIPKSELDARWHGVGDITADGIERLEHAGIVVTIPDPRYAPEEFHKIL